MTFQEFIDLITANPAYIIFYFSIIPFAALLANLLAKGEGNYAPWSYLYSILIYLVCVPGIFSITLNAYLFLFEQQSIFESNIFTQILPIVSMVLTIMIIKRNADLDLIPGFEKLSGLIMMIAATLLILFLIDRTRIYVFSYVPISHALIAFFILLLVIRYGWRRLSSN